MLNVCLLRIPTTQLLSDICFLQTKKTVQKSESGRCLRSRSINVLTALTSCGHGLIELHVFGKDIVENDCDSTSHDVRRLQESDDGITERLHEFLDIFIFAPDSTGEEWLGDDVRQSKGERIDHDNICASIPLQAFQNLQLPFKESPSMKRRRTLTPDMTT